MPLFGPTFATKIDLLHLPHLPCRLLLLLLFLLSSLLCSFYLSFFFSFFLTFFQSFYSIFLFSSSLFNFFLTCLSPPFHSLQILLLLHFAIFLIYPLFKRFVLPSTLRSYIKLNSLFTSISYTSCVLVLQPHSTCNVSALLLSVPPIILPPSPPFFTFYYNGVRLSCCLSSYRMFFIKAIEANF